MQTYEVEKLTLTNGETIAYRQTGNSHHKLLLIHGNMSSSVHFQRLMTELATDYHVIAVDLAGFGDSTYHVSKDRLILYAIEMVELLTQLQLEKVAVLGWSTGGGIALELAVLAPDMITQVYLLDSIGVKGFEMYRKDANFQPILTERLVTRADIANDPVQVLPILTAYENKDKNLIKMIWNTSIYLENQPSEAEYDLYVEAILKQRNLVDIDLALVHFNLTDESNGVAAGSSHLTKVTCPVIIIHGAKDLIVPVAEAEQTASFLKEQAELIIFPEGGHSILTDDLVNLAKTIKGTYRKGGV